MSDGQWEVHAHQSEPDGDQIRPACSCGWKHDDLAATEFEAKAIWNSEHNQPLLREAMGL